MSERPGAADSPGTAGRPDPSGAQTPAEFMDAFRRLKDWTGAGFRELEKRAVAAGEALPRSTLTAALSRDSLPREDLVVAFVRTCGGDDEEVRRWVETRRRIAGTSEPEPAAGRRTVLADLMPPAVRRAAWPVRVLVAALVAVVAVTVVAAVVSTVRDLTGPTGSDLARERQSSADPTTPPTTASPTSASPARQGIGWVEVRRGVDVTLADEQAIDFDTGTVGYWDDHNPGFDVGLSQRADRLVAPAPPTSVAVLDTPGEESPHRCVETPPGKWDGLVEGVHRIGAGRNVCVTTSERRCVMITVVRPPDSVVTVLTFHYTVWERR